MIYECDECEAVLTPGLTRCPHCGQVFDEPVPADATLDEPVPADATLDVPDVVLPATSPPIRDQITRKSRRLSSGEGLAAVLLLLGLAWIGYHYEFAPAAVAPSTASNASRVSTDLAAHPQYAAHMTALVSKLRMTGVGAEWPAFGSSDVLLITPQTRVAEQPAEWDADTYRRLAQGVYGHFAQNRFESGFSDTDTTACFVIVTSASGKIVAVDFMGNLK